MNHVIWKAARQSGYLLNVDMIFTIQKLFMQLLRRLWKGVNWKNWKKGKRKVQGEPKSQTAAFPRQQEETGKIKQAKIEERHEKH